MCRIIAIANQKGGVGKTTTCVNLGIGLARAGKKVLLVEADAQGSMAVSLGIQEPDELDVTLVNIMEKVINDEDVEPGEGIIRHEEGIDFIPANIELAGLETSLVNVMSREQVLRLYLEGVKADYDYILIDCMPSLGMITINALVAADSVLIPVEAAYLPVKGLQQLIKTIGKVHRRLNPRLSIMGILLTKVDRRTNFARDISEQIRDVYGNNIHIFENCIPMSVRAAETTAEGKSIYLHDPKGIVAEGYRHLTGEVLADENKSAEKIKLTSYDDLFGTKDNSVEGIYTTVALSQLHPFKNHPFKVLDDEKMQETVESVIQHGVIQPGIVRPCADGYEVVAGHRRWRACELAGKPDMPVIIRDLDDDAATVLMVDTNIQRENLLPSEKARAYKMKYEALKHQGSKGDKHTADVVGEKAGDSGRTVQRYIRLASLINGLLDLVDTGKIAMIAGERLSYLKLEEQEMVMEAAENIGVYPSPAQAGQLKVMSEEGMLSEGSIYALLVKKEGGGQTVTISSKKIRDYFPPAYTKEQIEEVIYSLLDQWKQGKEGELNAGDTV